mmetsp:Transcript_27216/g.40945  ORF Transcript_27216/g.40945 Transcript_27216/m.40945 type:complete len:929 (+) Transcript_27216:115-2901(+)
MHDQMILGLVFVYLVIEVAVVESFVFNPRRYLAPTRRATHLLNAHRRRNHYYRSSSARNNANLTEFDTLAMPSSTATATMSMPSFSFGKFDKRVDNIVSGNSNDNDMEMIQDPLDKEQQPRNKTFFIPFDTSSSTTITTQALPAIATENDATIAKAGIINSSDGQSFNNYFFKTAKIDGNNNNSTIASTTEILTIDKNITQDNGEGSNGGNSTEDIDMLTVKNPNTVCRIVASADYKIPSLSLLKRKTQPGQEYEQLEHELLLDIDAITHARIHSQTQKQFQYMESIEKEHKNDQSGSLSSLEVSDNPKMYNDEKEEQLSQTLRQSLEDSGFQLLSQRDIELCEALNSEYLLRLSILPDVSELDPCIGREFYPELYGDKFDSNDNDEENDTSIINKGDTRIERDLMLAKDGSTGAVFDKSKKEMTNEEVDRKEAKSSTIKSPNSNSDSGLLYDGRILVYRRGYSQEVTTGRLLLPKFDYLQSSLVQRIASNFARKIFDVEMKITDTIVEFINKIVQSIVDEIPQRLRIFVKKTIQQGQVNSVPNDNDTAIGNDEEDNNKSKMNMKLGRYRSGRFVDSTGNGDSLSPFMVCELTDENTDNVDIDKDLYDVLKTGFACQHDLNQKGNSVEQVQLLKRISISTLVDFFSVGGRRKLIKSLFAESELVEPTYEEVILIWRPLPDKTKVKKGIKLPQIMYDVAEIFEVENRLPEKPTSEQRKMPLEIRAFDSVPMANLLAVFPRTKLIFRPADAFIFDLINITTFLAVLSSVRFDSTKLDIIAIVSGVLWVLRTFFRYSNKLARYDLLVNKFLTSRISHRNLGALRYVVDEAAMQRARRASLVHEWLVQYVKQQPVGTVLTRDHILRNGVFGINEIYQPKQPIQLDLNAALVDLVDLELISFSDDSSAVLLEVKVGMNAKKSLKNVWNDIFQK